ncbi:MAG: MarR family transcriptional regulator [Micromonosporaceae bacterium]|nr:MarR family transcriptional regulator [Micromonosporaceae bacterium]
MGDAEAKPGQDEFQAAFWGAKRALAVAAEAAYNRHGVRSGQQFILRCLWETDGLTPGEIARRLELATPTVTRAATRMEAAGLLRRSPHPTDARLVRLVLTDRGRELEGVIAEEMKRLSEKALRGLSPEEQAQLLRSLHTIRVNLTR